MRPSVMTFFVLLTGIMIIGVLWGCGGDDDPTEPSGADCSITITSPGPGLTFQSEDSANIRWTSTGSAESVRITLLQDGAAVGDIAESTEDDGYFPWNADVMGGTGGDGFSIRVAALGEDGCEDEVGGLTILNTAACAIEWTAEFPLDSHDDPLPLMGDDEFAITWNSHDTTGAVDIELWHGHLLQTFVGTIASGTPDDGSFTWTVDSFNDSAHRVVSDLSIYWIRIHDPEVPGTCEAASPDFSLWDESICEIRGVVIPTLQFGSLPSGQTVTVTFDASDLGPAGLVKVRLYAGSVAVPGGFITLTDVPATDGQVQWVVSDYGFTQGGSNFNVRVIDANDEYCWGRSTNFSITD